MKYSLSIIVPYYNEPKRIHRLLNSIPFDKRIETIVINDQSTDHNFDWIEQFQDNLNLRVCSLTLKGNAGGARNLGLHISRSDYVLFADSDDYFNTEIFNSVMEYVNNQKYDLVIFDSIAVYEDSNEISQRDSYRRSIYKIGAKKAAILSTSPWAKLIRKQLIDEHKLLFSDSEVANDIYFSTRLALLSNRIHLDKNILYTVIDRIDSLTKDVSEDAAMKRLTEQIKKFELLKKHDKKSFSYFRYHSHNLPRFNKLNNNLQSNRFTKLLKQYKSLLGVRVIIVHTVYRVFFEKILK